MNFTAKNKPEIRVTMENTWEAGVKGGRSFAASARWPINEGDIFPARGKEHGASRD